MSQRASGYERRALDLYETPAWVVAALAEHVPLARRTIWEPACGTGKMVEALKVAGALPVWSDVFDHGYEATHEHDFLTDGPCPFLVHYDGIITNPPYGPRAETATGFIRAGLDRIRDYGFLALLLPVDFDSAKGRAQFFGDCDRFAAKIILTDRIRWFDGGSSPSVNHAWFLWQSTWLGDRHGPRLLYAGRAAE